MKKEKRIIFLNVLFLLLTLLSLAGYLLIKLLKIGDDYAYLDYIFIIVCPLCSAGLSVSLFLWVNVYKEVKNLRIENRYQFGADSDFPNYFIFAKRIKLLKKRHKKDEKAHLVSFTVSYLSMATNTGQNEDVTKLNRLISEFIVKHFSSHALKEHFVYCFYHGQFLFYVFGSDKNIQEISLVLDNECYEIAKQNDIKVFVHPFIGVAEVDNKETLLVNLDNALFARGLSEKNFEGITFYAPALRKNVSQSEIDEIKQGLENKEFVVYYQPKFHLGSKLFISAEALVRWNSKEYGLLSPAKFIEKAERGGLIHGLDMYVFRKVCEDLAWARQKNKRLLPVSVNFSLHEFYAPSFIEDLMDIVKEYRLNPSLLEIEITESTSQANPFMAVSLLKKLKECGFRILMDDFGLAYSNLGNLNKMPFDTVKIDKSFIDGITSDFKTREIIRFLISLCKASGMEVIAEGVDQLEQVNILKKIRCDTIQGYYYSEPLNKDDYMAFLVENPFETRRERKEDE